MQGHRQLGSVIDRRLRASPSTRFLALAWLTLVVSLAGVDRASAAPCPNDALRQGPGSHLPNCRAYEQVSPVDKNGGDIIGTSTAPPIRSKSVSYLGDRIMFTSLAEFAGPTSGGSL